MTTLLSPLSPVKAAFLSANSESCPGTGGGERGRRASERIHLACKLSGKCCIALPLKCLACVPVLGLRWYQATSWTNVDDWMIFCCCYLIVISVWTSSARPLPNPPPLHSLAACALLPFSNRSGIARRVLTFLWTVFRGLQFSAALGGNQRGPSLCLALKLLAFWLCLFSYICSFLQKVLVCTVREKLFTLWKTVFEKCFFFLE